MGQGKDLLLNFIDDHDYKRKTIAESVGVSCATLSNFLNGKRPLNFDVAFSIQNIFFKKDREFIRSVCLSYDKMEHVRPALEFLSINFLLDDLEKLLNKIEGYHGFEEVHSVYSFVLKYQRKLHSYEIILRDLKGLYSEVKSMDLTALLHTIEANIYSLTREYKSLFRVAEESRLLIENLERGFVKECFRIRMYEVLAQAHLFHNNDLEKSRKYAELIFSMKICAKSEAYASYIIGTSFMFQDYAESSFHLSESVKKYQELGLIAHRDTILNQNIKLLETTWSHRLDETDGFMDDSELAYRYAKRGDSDAALNLLDGLDETAFRVYYRALATEDYSLHLKSLGMFMKEGDMFYAQFPLKELSKKEEFKELIKNIL
ncbi:hypothetical protein SAMN05216389_11142 [Oceanobacillus limi]|uniref:HTH cro/C1-type domain-containing protein n=1 Tax=Oceanobacillus limi TaxID=930131 RepID=A0A1I0EEE7_9BACI|nr:AimR family lysis-lysogeny pheromone receptor [Oceanobacillus limi]SET42909.1 hypothetical protein SAMN05216389_11142 [Oceanobacillus limi]